MRIFALLSIIFLLPGSVAAVSVDGIEVYELGDDGFVVGWSTDEPSTSQLLYGTSGRLGSSTIVDSTLKTDHQVQVDNLDDNTVYFFRARGINSQGEDYFSVIGVTRTSESVITDPVDDTPISDDDIDVEFYITEFELGQEEFGVVTNGDTIDLAEYLDRNDVTLGARISQNHGNALFYLNDEYLNIEGRSPFTLLTSFDEWASVGTHTIRAEFYENIDPNRQNLGQLIASEELEITFIETPADTNSNDDSQLFGVDTFVITSERDGVILAELKNGDTIDVSNYDDTYTIAATTFGATDSVIFFLDDAYQNTQNGAPFTLFDDFDAWAIPGTYTLRADAYDQDSQYDQTQGTGNKGSSKSITITVVDSGSDATTPSPDPQPTPTPNPGPISSELQDLQEEFDNAWSREGSRYQSISQKGHQGDIYYWFAGFDGNLAMFQATGETQYLDNAIDLVDTLFDTAIPSRLFPSSSLPSYTSVEKIAFPSPNDNYLSWDNHGDRVTTQGATDGGQASLYEGHGLRQVPKLLWVLDNSPQLRASGYQDDYNRIKAFYEEHVWNKWVSRGIGNIYRSRTHMASHWANAALYLYEIEDNPTKKAEYKEVVDNFNHDMGARASYPDGIGMRDQLRPHPSASGGYLWDGVWGGTGANDHSHANAEVNFMINSQELGIEYTVADMRALIITLDEVLFLGDAGHGDVPYYMDGRFRDNYRNTAWFDQGWSMLGRFDEDLHKRLQTRDRVQSTSSNYQSTFWGNMAYSQAYLDGNVKYPENYYQNN